MAEHKSSTLKPLPDSDDSDIEMPRDTIFSILQNDRRRKILRYLHSEGGPVSVNELAIHISSSEQGVSVAPDSKAYKSVYVSLHQSHLPKMQNAGVISRDDEANTVKLLPASTPLLDHLYIEDDSLTDLPVDIKETERHLTISIDLPGFTREEITLKAGHSELEIIAERSENLDDDAKFEKRERPTKVKRTIPLSVPVSVSQTEAELELGVLTITFLKVQASDEKKPISIR